jgi:CheY-like chemotaxis protein
MTILYVDDDPEDIDIFQDAVNTVDAAIYYEAALSGAEALSYLNITPTLPDYVILDINMPGMDGKLCLHEMRKNPRLAGLKVIVYSTNSFPRDITEIESLNATFVKKANSFNDLCDMIRRLINGEDMHTEA